jgi:arylsulfatase A-like enzyme
LLDKDAEGSALYPGIYTLRKRAATVDREVLNWISSNRKHPFFAMLNFFDVHDPYGVPSSYRPGDRGEDPTRYDEGVVYVDKQIAILMDGLKALGLAQNTLVIITADHGESLGNHGLRSHGSTLYWEQIHVPLIVWYPGHIPARVRIDTPVSIASLPATILSLSSDREPQQFPLPSLSEFWSRQGMGEGWPPPRSELAGSISISPDDAIAAAKQGVPISTEGPMSSIVFPQWHVILHEKFGTQLYDWKSDPGEQRNLANTPQGQTVLATLASGR